MKKLLCVCVCVCVPARVCVYVPGRVYICGICGCVRVCTPGGCVLAYARARGCVLHYICFNVWVHLALKAPQTRISANEGSIQGYQLYVMLSHSCITVSLYREEAFQLGRTGCIRNRNPGLDLHLCKKLLHSNQLSYSE